MIKRVLVALRFSSFRQKRPTLPWNKTLHAISSWTKEKWWYSRYLTTGLRIFWRFDLLGKIFYYGAQIVCFGDTWLAFSSWTLIFSEKEAFIACNSNWKIFALIFDPKIFDEIFPSFGCLTFLFVNISMFNSCFQNAMQHVTRVTITIRFILHVFLVQSVLF